MRAVLSDNSPPQPKLTKSPTQHWRVGRPVVSRSTDLPQTSVREGVARLKDIHDSGQKKRLHRFSYGGAFAHVGQVPVERCLSAKEAAFKIGAIQRLTGWPIAQVQTDWNQILSGWVSAIGQIVLTVGRAERARAICEMANSWCRLDGCFEGW